MIAAGSDDLYAFIYRPHSFYVNILSAKGTDGSLSDSPVCKNRHMTITVRTNLSDRHRRLLFRFNNLSFHDKCVVAGSRQILIVCPFSAKQHRLTKTKVIDSFRNPVFQHQVNSRRIATTDTYRCIVFLCQTKKPVHFFLIRLYKRKTGQICTKSIQIQPLCLLCIVYRFCQMFFFKIAFPQIAQIHHQNYFVFLFQLYSLLVKCFQCLKLRVYRHITELHHFSRLRYGWHTDQPLFTRQIFIISDIFNSGISQPFYPLIHQSLSNPFLATKNFGYTSYFYMVFFSQIFHDSCILCNFIQIDMYAWIQL